MQRGPQTKLPTYDGQDDVDVFLVPFERIAERCAWSEIEKIDILYESLKGKAMWYVCSLPRAMRRLVTQAYPGTDLEMQMLS